MPIVFDPGRIICTNNVHGAKLLRHLNRQLVFAAARRIGAADFVLPPKFHEVDKADDLMRLSLVRGGLAVLSRSDWHA